MKQRHNNASDINDIGKEYTHREHRGTQRIDLKTLCPLCPLWLNPVAFTACVGSIRPQQISVDLLDSCHSFKRDIRDCKRSDQRRRHKVHTKRSRMVTKDANCTNVRTRAHHHKNQSVFTGVFNYALNYREQTGMFIPKIWMKE